MHRRGMLLLSSSVCPIQSFLQKVRPEKPNLIMIQKSIMVEKWSKTRGVGAGQAGQANSINDFDHSQIKRKDENNEKTALGTLPQRRPGVRVKLSLVLRLIRGLRVNRVGHAS
jgi:hypothetical protein